MHNIFGDRFFGRTGPAWHELGTTDPRVTRCVTAVKRAGLDYQVRLANITAQIPAELGGGSAPITNRMAIMRDPTNDDPEYRFFGFASEDYGIMQNMDIAKAMDMLTDTWPVETVGALGKGETIFLTLDAGDRKIKGEDIKMFFLVTDTRDGGTAMKIAFTPVRVVCQNTLVAGLKSAVLNVPLEHVAGLSGAFSSRMELVKRLTAAQDATMNAFDAMAKYRLQAGEFEQILDATYPMPSKPKKADLLDEFTTEEDIASIGALYAEATEAQNLWMYYAGRNVVFRDAATELFTKFNNEFPKTAETAWAAYNAVVESADWRKGADSVPASSLFGPRANEKKRAFKAAYGLLAK